MRTESVPTGASTFLTPTLAQEIAGETSAIIGLNIIITDGRGIVLGSGDESRIGSFHEASLGVVESQRSAAHNAEEAARLQGVRPGMTLPIVHRGMAVGTVGITGSPGKVRRFGQVVRRQTEILLEEAVLLRSRMTRERVLENLLRDMLNYDPDAHTDLTARAHDFGFDLTLPRQAIVVEITRHGPESPGSVQTSPLRLIRDVFHDSQDISCSISSTTYVVLRRYDEAHDSLTRADVDELAERMTDQHGWPTRIGKGGPAQSIDAIASSYLEARSAIRIGVSTGRPSPYDIEELRVEQLVTAIPGRVKERVSEEVLGPLRTKGDWASTRATVLAWVESGFVLVEAARSLNVHRNTLVYRLQRISTITGRPTTDRRGWLVLYLACTADALSTHDHTDRVAPPRDGSSRGVRQMDLRWG
jgi:carbohydrate diacid regulator